MMWGFNVSFRKILRGDNICVYQNSPVPLPSGNFADLCMRDETIINVLFKRNLERKFI